MTQRLRITALLLMSAMTVGMPARGAARAGSADVTGVVHDENGTPVAGATVNLVGSGGVVKSSVSNARGFYSLANMPAGNYTVLLEAAGFQTSRYINLTVKPDLPLVYDFTIRTGVALPIAVVDARRGYGAISGRILNHDGSPAIAVDVAAIAARDLTPPLPEQILASNLPNAAAQTDGGGRFRIDDLPPGQYFLAAGSIPAFLGYGPGGSGGRPTLAMNRPVYLPVYLPASDAASLTVSAGLASPVEFRLPASTSATPRFRIDGRAQDAPPLTLNNANRQGPLTKATINGVVSLYSPSCPRPGPLRQVNPPPHIITSTPMASDGAFEFRDIPPGDYAVCVIIGVRSPIPGPSFAVTDRDVSAVVLPRMSGVTLPAIAPPSMAGSGPLVLDWPSIRAAEKRKLEAREKAQKEALKQAEKERQAQEKAEKENLKSLQRK